MCKFLLGLTWGLAIGAVGGFLGVCVVESSDHKHFSEVLQKYSESVENKNKTDNSVEIGAEE